MIKNKSYIWVSLIVLIFGIIVVPEIVQRYKDGKVVEGVRLDNVSGPIKHDGKLLTIGKVPDFKLINQDGKTITNQDFAGKVYILEFFFSTCPTICPKMNQNMLLLENKFFGNPNFGIASITINPEVDTPEVLKEHAELLGVKSSNWHFLTGDKAYIMDLSNKGFNLYAGQNVNADGGFEHSGLFALIDKNGMIRSRKDNHGNAMLYYDGIEPEGIEAIQQDIAILLKE